MLIKRHTETVNGGQHRTPVVSERMSDRGYRIIIVMAPLRALTSLYTRVIWGEETAQPFYFSVIVVKAQRTWRGLFLFI